MSGIEPRPTRDLLSPILHAPCWRSCLLGFIAAVVALGLLALVDRLPSRGPLLDPRLTPQARALARRALAPLDGGPEWRIVSRVATPWGEVVRLRPFVSGLEVRGADCVLEGDSTAGSSGLVSGDGPARGPARWVLENDPASVDWKSLLRETPRWSRSRRAGILRALGAEAVTPAATDDQGTLPFFVELRPGENPAWVLGLDVSLPPAAGRADARAALLALPWEGKPPEARAPLLLRLTLDPRDLSVIRARDLRCLDRPPDRDQVRPGAHATSEAEGTGLVFDPNPVVESGNGALREGDPVDRFRRWMPLPRLDGSGSLQGRWIVTATDRPPHAQEPGWVFGYPSADPRFDEVMAYYHGDRGLELVDSLGFHGLFPTPLTMRVHGTPLDNSWYSPIDHSITFGDGGVPDADDGEIILHEEGHAIHDALVPGFGAGDTRAISEGFGDFWSASLTGQTCVGSWDATAYSPPCLRRVDNNVTYPASLVGEPHLDGEIWSATLWDLRALLGSAPAERLALAAFLEQGTSSSFTDAAQGLLRAASRIGQTGQLSGIEDVLARRGLIPREIAVTLQPDETRRYALVRPAQFLGRSVAALVVGGDGRLLFAPSAGADTVSRFPAGPPSAFPCGLASAKSGVTVRVSGSLDGRQALLSQEWMDGARTLARLDLVWEMNDGSLDWTYAEIPGGASGLPFFAGVTAGGISTDSLTEIPLASLPRAGLHGLRGFRGAIGGSGASMLGARFRVTAEDGGHSFSLRQETAALGVGDSQVKLQALPNPFREATSLRLFLRNDGRARVEIFDLAGRCVRRIADGPLSAGMNSVTWDGRDDAGRLVGAGMYWARAEAGGRAAQLRCLRLR